MDHYDKEIVRDRKTLKVLRLSQVTERRAAVKGADAFLGFLQRDHVLQKVTKDLRFKTSTKHSDLKPIRNFWVGKEHRRRKEVFSGS